MAFYNAADYHEDMVNEAVYPHQVDQYGAPIWTLPPDLVVEDHEFILQSDKAPSVWHLPSDRWDVIWKLFRGQGERIAILDTGYTPHSFLPTPVAQRSFISGQSVTDGNGHGNHCAGTALGRRGIGVAQDAELIVGKVLSNQGSGSSEGIAAGIEWAIEQGATIISMSLGGGGSHARSEAAINHAHSLNILVCASAGNSGQRPGQNTMGYPARYPRSYASGSMAENGSISGFSSAGPQMDGVTPGSNIVSTSNTNPNGWKTMSGTSMSCPFSAGLFAVIRSAMARSGYPVLGGVEAWRPWLSQFFMDRGPAGKDDVWGYGIPDYNKIVAWLFDESIKYV